MKRPQSLQTSNSSENGELLLSVFGTEIGWTGILGRDDLVVAIVIGHPSPASVAKGIRRSISDFASVGGDSIHEIDWIPDLRQRLQDYASGELVDFSSFRLSLPPQTKFREKVLAATKALRYGETTTYGELAQRVGHPGAARAVGTVMATNRFPILIPCHRVLASGGKLGGYTSPSGTKLKQRLLAMEQAGSSSMDG